MANLSTSNFKRLIGVWKTSGKIFTDEAELDLSGTDSYEMMLKDNFILHKADVCMGDENSQTFEIIKLSDTDSYAKMHYFNSEGESGKMTSTLNDNDFSIDGDGIKFIGKINEANTTVIGNWFTQIDDKDWIKFIELKLTKQNNL